MDRLKLIIIFLTVSVLVLVLLHQGETCNKAVCGNIITKCLFIESCRCNLTDYSCSRQCSICLKLKYTECCACLRICPKPIETSNDLSKLSRVEKYGQGDPGLFAVLTELPDPLDRWESFTFPVDINSTQHKSQNDSKIQIKDANKGDKNITVALNCTVAFMTSCLSGEKCKSSCLSMGASSYRWFHDGCCECVGSNCINFGIDESRCTQCPSNPDLEEIDEDDLDYGEEEEFDI